MRSFLDRCFAEPGQGHRGSSGMMKLILRVAAVFAALVGAGGGQAFAISAGCTAWNAIGSGTVQNSSPNAEPVFGSALIGGFSVGDVLSVTGSGSVLFERVLDQNNTNVPLVNGAGTATHTITASDISGGKTFLGQVVGTFGSASIAYSFACTPAGGGSSDSQNLRSVQSMVSKMVASFSGATISSSVGGAINDAFSNSGNPITPGSNGFSVNFAAEPKPDPKKQDAYDALAYASGSRMPTKAPALFAREWSLWADVRGSGFDSNDSNSIHGHQANITGGIGRKITPDFLIGVFTGYENFNFTINSLAAKMTGNGGTIGTYAAYRVAPNWRIDGVLGWSGILYNGTAGAATGSFRGSRWLASGGFTGNYNVSVWLLEPSVQIYTLWENENAFTDSLGTVQPSRNFSEGRVATGGKVSYPWQVNGMRVSPYVGLYGDWRFSSDNAVPVNVPSVGLKNGWSARVTSGVMLTAQNAASVSLGGELGGLGAGYDIWSANARVTWPF